MTDYQKGFAAGIEAAAGEARQWVIKDGDIPSTIEQRIRALRRPAAPADMRPCSLQDPGNGVVGLESQPGAPLSASALAGAYMIVPCTPTLEMIMAGHDWCRRDRSYSMDSAARCYEAMIKAAPAGAPSEEDVATELRQHLAIGVYKSLIVARAVMALYRQTKELTVIITIEEGATGLWYGMAADNAGPYKGLLITGKTMDEVLDQISPTIKNLREAAQEAQRANLEQSR